MFTLEQKVDLILRYIATADKTQRSQLKKLVVEALNSDEPVAVATAMPEIDDMIIDLLKELGMPQGLLGYKYTLRAIKLCIIDPTYARTITCRLYPDIAAIYDSTPSRVERAIRCAIETMFNNGNLENVSRIFGAVVSSSKGKLTNREFIVSCANEIERHMKKNGVVAK